MVELERRTRRSNDTRDRFKQSRSHENEKKTQFFFVFIAYFRHRKVGHLHREQALNGTVIATPKRIVYNVGTLQSFCFCRLVFSKLNVTLFCAPCLGAESAVVVAIAVNFITSGPFCSSRNIQYCSLFFSFLLSTAH